MSELISAEVTLRPGSRRVQSVWMEPSAAGRQRVPQSEGAWVQREPHTFARLTVRVPITVGSSLTTR